MLYQGIIGGGSSPVEPVDLSPVLLWTNPNTRSEFIAQTVNLDLTDYAGVIVEFYLASESEQRQFVASRVYVTREDATKAAFGGGAMLSFGSSSSLQRNVKMNDTGVIFGEGYVDATVTSYAMIPYKIYGVKEYVVEPVTSKKIVPSDYVNFNASTGFTAVVGTYYAVVQGSDNNADPTFNGATILKTGFNQRTSSADRAYLSIIQATSTTITSNKNGTYCALNLE